MSDSTRPRVKQGRPPKISRPEILAAARRVIDDRGIARLTMRQLATELGTTPMAIYYHVQNRDELLLLLLDDYAGGVDRPCLPDEPRARLVAAAATVHDVLARCPWIVEVLTADDLVAGSALWIVETIVDAAVACGLGPDEAVRAYRAIWYYTAGEIVVRAARRPSDAELLGRLDPVAHPRLSSLAERWPELAGEDTYRHGLQALVAGLLD
ncbi:TetR/AcrR family transcriptional regulator [Dactylosporangium sp. NPDC051485]|uniref:TetR/AcrR family transcriptional regulator n=1 Tax=Dactylosporangium sp. NPDC051485 TaxID=3154846 RepID=UPI0034242A67